MTSAAIRAACAALPGATEDVKWGEDLVYSVGKKMFVVMNLGAGTFSFKVDSDRFLELTDRKGIIPAPYLARAKWVQVTETGALSEAEAVELVTRSYELVFAKLTRQMQKEIQHG